MLVLSRKVEEEIVIRDPRIEEITVRVIRAHGGKVRLAWDANPQTKILRRELLDRPKEDEAA